MRGKTVKLSTSGNVFSNVWFLDGWYKLYTSYFLRSNFWYTKKYKNTLSNFGFDWKICKNKPVYITSTTLYIMFFEKKKKRYTSRDVYW